MRRKKMSLEEARQLKQEMKELIGIDGPCPNCKGTGKIGKKFCEYCGGAGLKGSVKLKPVGQKPAPAMKRPKRK
jgi:hypothetical protein